MPYNNYRQYIIVSILENDLHVQVDCVQVDRSCSQNFIDLIKTGTVLKVSRTIAAKLLFI